MKKKYTLFSLVILGLMVTFVCYASAYPIDMHNPITFISQPPATGQAGVPYMYTAQAVSTDSTDTLRYFVAKQRMFFPVSQNVKIDSVTGILNWTPTSKGFFPITLIAKSLKGGYATQSFVVTVTRGNGIVQGTVLDTMGNPIKNIIIEALQTSVPFISAECFNYSAKTDSNGNYSISRIDPGSYILHAISTTSQYQSQWYDGVTDPTKATLVQIADSIPASINFTLHSKVIITKLNISGMVTDSTNAPLKHARVYFVPSGFVLNSNDSVDDYKECFASVRGDFRIDGGYQRIYSSTTDSAGRYSLKIIPGTYIAFAKDAGYVTEYYSGQTDIFSATQLALQADTSGIDFSLASVPPVVLGTINGVVFDSVNNVGIPSRVVAFRDRWMSKDHYKMARSYTVDSDSLGAFSLTQLLPGTYFVLALPLGKYAPAYYTVDTASTHWKKATSIVINGTTVDHVAIYVHSIPQFCNGFTHISGRVNSPSDVSGTFVYATSGNTIAGFAITDSRGNYSINGIAAGAYNVEANKLGDNEPASQSVTTSYSTLGNSSGYAVGTALNGNVDFSISATTAVGQQPSTQPTQFVLLQNYPNPFNPSTTIGYILNQPGMVTLKIYNILGQEVGTLVNEFKTAGSYQIKFDASKLSSGVYFYKLQAGSGMSATKQLLLLK